MKTDTQSSAITRYKEKLQETLENYVYHPEAFDQDLRISVAVDLLVEAMEEAERIGEERVRKESQELIDIVSEMLEECPRAVDQATVSKGKTPDDAPDYQVITEWSIALTRVRKLEKALAKLKEQDRS